MKTIKQMLITVAVLLCSATASAHDFEVDGIYYNIISTKDKTVEVTYRGDSYENEYIGEVVIPSSVIYNRNTYSVTSIGKSAFSVCPRLTSITIPNSVTSIGEAAFSFCSSLTSITIPEGVTRIGNEAFYYCSGLTSITIPNSVTSIGNYAFQYCSRLNSITIPNRVTSIGNYAFERCSSLESVYSQMKTPCAYPGYFGGSPVLYIPSGTRDLYIEQGWDDWASKFVEFDYEQNFTVDNIKYKVLSAEELTCEVVGGFVSGDIVLPANVINPVTSIEYSVTSIGKSAFRDCSSLTSITIPNSVTSIGSYAFSGCYGLTSITIPNSLTSIGIGTFSSCSGLTSITIPEDVTNIGDGAFLSCSGLTSITIPNSVTSIGNEAFYYCSGLTSITIPEGVTSIGDYAFDGCSSLESVYSQMKTPCAYPGDFGGSPVLYIPAGTRDLYIEQEWDDWASEIVEMKISSTLAVSDVKVTHGASVILPVSMENEESITAFQFEVSLPEGVSLVGCELTDRKSDQTLSFSELPNGNYQVTALSLTSKAFKDSEGALVNLQLATEKEMEAGEYNVTVKNIELTTTDEDALRPANCTAKLTVTDVMVGDSNGDGKISITDAVAIVNYILSKPSSSFAVEAADVNMDAKVTITDAVAIVNKILAGTTEAKSRAADMQLDPQ